MKPSKHDYTLVTLYAAEAMARDAYRRGLVDAAHLRCLLCNYDVPELRGGTVYYHANNLSFCDANAIWKRIAEHDKENADG